jgi:hypothetical protein
LNAQLFFGNLMIRKTDVLKGQPILAQRQRLGDFEIVVMCGLKAQLNLPFQSAIVYNTIENPGRPAFRRICHWAELI